MQFNANLLVGKAHIGMQGLKLGDETEIEIEIEIGKKQIRSIPVGASDEEN